LSTTDVVGDSGNCCWCWPQKDVVVVVVLGDGGICYWYWLQKDVVVFVVVVVGDDSQLVVMMTGLLVLCCGHHWMQQLTSVQAQPAIRRCFLLLTFVFELVCML
jgi:hypothetical protein